MPKDRFRVAVVGHLREEKDPFRTALALSHVKPDLDLEVVQIGDALSPGFARKARQLMRREPRYRWLGGRPHREALGWIARSHALVVSSIMEGGANVICEAARIGTPVLASRMSGNVGMLGRNYPGYFPLSDDRALARLMEKAFLEKSFYSSLKRALAARRRLFAPPAERTALARVVREALRRRA
jgi:glycosyltransferase involved in cell wall biosynthesis